MNQFLLKILQAGLLLLTLFSCCENPQDTPQITGIEKTPQILSKSGETYTVTLQTANVKNAEFSMDGKKWQKEKVFQNVEGGKKYTFYARNTKNKSLQDQKEMFFKEYRNVPVPTKEQLNNYLKLIADYDDDARDSMRKYLDNDCPVKGVANISNVRQLILETPNGAGFSVTDIEVNNGIVTAISVIKN